jgi:hypothetical protein
VSSIVRNAVSGGEMKLSRIATDVFGNALAEAVAKDPILVQGPSEINGPLAEFNRLSAAFGRGPIANPAAGDAVVLWADARPAVAKSGGPDALRSLGWNSASEGYVPAVHTLEPVVITASASDNSYDTAEAKRFSNYPAPNTAAFDAVRLALQQMRPSPNSSGRVNEQLQSFMSKSRYERLMDSLKTPYSANFGSGQSVGPVTGDGVLPGPRYLKSIGALATNAGTVEAHVGPVVGPAVATTFGGIPGLIVRGGIAASAGFQVGFGIASVDDGNSLDGSLKIAGGLLELTGAALPIRGQGRLVSGPVRPALVGNTGSVGGASAVDAVGGAANTGPTRLYHYTNEAGMNGIVDSAQLNPSLKALNPNDVRYGNGQYLSDIPPGTRTPSELSYDFLGMPFQARRFTNYVEIDVTGLNVVQGRPGVFVVPNEVPLDLTGRIVGNGKVVKP